MSENVNPEEKNIDTVNDIPPIQEKPAAADNDEEKEETREEFIARIQRENEERAAKKAAAKEAAAAAGTENTPVVPEETDGSDETVAEEDAAEGDNEPVREEPPTGEILGKIDLIYNEEDILVATDMQQDSSTGLKVFRWILMLMPVVMEGIAVATWIIEKKNKISDMIIYALLGLFVWYLYSVAPKRNAKRVFDGINEDQMKGLFTKFTVYEGGIYAEAGENANSFDWKQFKSIIECPAGILLTTFGRSAVFFPDRLLSGFDRKRLSAIFLEQFPKGYRVTNYKTKSQKQSEAK